MTVPAILPPSFGVIADPLPIVEDIGEEQLVDISDIRKGRASGPALRWVATSSNPALVPNPAIDFVAGSATAVLRYLPSDDANGKAVITVRATDAGADGVFGGSNSDDGIFERSFTITVLPVNDPPVFTTPDILSVKRDADCSPLPTLPPISDQAVVLTKRLRFSMGSCSPPIVVSFRSCRRSTAVVRSRLHPTQTSSALFQ